MKRVIFLFIILYIVGFSGVVSAQQSKYWVFFTDKKGVTFDPYMYFDARTIERRLIHGIPLVDSTDFPLNETYIRSVASMVDSISHSSRWFNALAVNADDRQIQAVAALPFVVAVEKMEAIVFLAETQDKSWDTLVTPVSEELQANQLKRMGGDNFMDAGIDGKGIRIAIFDGGFPAVNTSPVFAHIRNDGRIIKTWDFTKDKEFVYDYIAHGTMVMSCIAGIVNGKKIGLATGAEFLLARTEVKREPFSEEENWLAAAEWADKNGADIINSSLGYTYRRYFKYQMDGKTTLVTRAANMAAKKGMLVVNAAGNDGADDWKIIGAPADADSALSVGGIDPKTDFHIFFSSYGPTSDKRLKPNVCAYGHVNVAGKTGMEESDGTSFASPLVAGFAACAWQQKRSLSNMQVFNEIEKSGDLYPYFDYAHGYGVPQASYFTTDTVIEQVPTFDIVAANGMVYVNVYEDYITAHPDKSNRYVYYHIQQADGTLKEYAIILAFESQVLKLNMADYKKGQKLTVHLGNYTRSFEF